MRGGGRKPFGIFPKIHPIWRGHPFPGLSLGHFGQQVPESLKALIFSMGILEGVKWLISQVDYNGPKQQGISYTVFEMH